MRRVRGVLLDLSGVIYVGKQIVPGALEALERLHGAGVPVRYITNTTRSTRAQVVSKLATLGLQIDEEHLFTAPLMTRDYLNQNQLVPHLLIHPQLEPEFADCLAGTPNVVVVGDAGRAFTYDNLSRAFRLLLQGCPLLAMGMSRYFRDDRELCLDLGPFVKALEYAADTQATVLGKPAPAFFQAAAASLDCAPDAVLMVGDDWESDVEGALRAGLQAVLVKTGKYRSGDETRIGMTGASVAEDLSAAVDRLLTTS